MTSQKLELLSGTMALIALELLHSGPANGSGWIKGRGGMSENDRCARFYDLTASCANPLGSERRDWQRFQQASALILASE